MAKPFVRRIAKWVGRIALGLILFLVGLLLLVTFAMDLPPVRELVRKQANAQLEKALVGKVTLDRIGALGFTGVAGVDATVDDPKGKRVVALQGLSVDTFWPRIVWSALTDDTGIDIGIDALKLDHAEVAVWDDGSGQPTLAAAFQPKPTPTPSPGPSTDVRLRVGRIRVDHVWVHGRLGDGPTIDGDIRDVLADLASDAKGTRASLDRLRLVFRGLPEKIDPSGTLAGRIDLPSSAGPRGSGRFVGSVADAKIVADGGWDGETLRALLESPDVSRAGGRAGLDVRDPTSLRVTANGRWPDIGFTGELAGKAIHLEFRGRARVADETRIDATLDVKDTDLSRLVREAPPSSLATHAELGFRMPASGELEGTYRVEIPRGRVEEQATPALATDGEVRQSKAGELRLDGHLTVDEKGAPIDVAYALRAKDGRVMAHAEVDGRFDNPPRLAALGVRAKGSLTASGDFDSATSAVSADARLRLASVRHQAVDGRAIAMNVKVRGNTADPTVFADLTAGPVTVSDRKFSHVATTISGKSTELMVHALVLGESPKRVEVATRLSLVRATELEGIRVVAYDDKEPVELRVEKVVASNGVIRVDGLTIRGAGNADGRLALSPNAQHIELVANDLELERLTRLAGVRVPFQRARLTADVSLDRKRDILEGRVQARATEVQIGKLENSSASVDVTLTPKNVSGTASANFGEGGRLHVELDEFEPPRGPFTLERALHQPGSIVTRGELRLQGFLPLIEATGLPIDRVAGTLTFDIQASGGSSATGPRVEARAETKGLRIVERRPKHDPITTVQEARDVEPRALEGVDLKVLFQLEPKERTARLELEAFDPYGTIARLNGDARLEDGWPRTIRKTWRTMPLRAKLEMPRRPFEIFPVLVRPAATKGIASATIALEGSVADPVVDADLELDALRVQQRDQPLRAVLSAHYDRARGNLSLTGEASGRSVGKIEATWKGDAARLATAGVKGRSPIELDLDGELRDFPLDSISALADRQIRGPLSGTIRLAGLGRDAELEVSLDGSKMTIGEVRMERLRADIDASGGRLRARLEGADKKGKVELEVSAPARWGDRLAPELPKEADGRLTAKAFSLETLGPALKPVLNEIGGRLDADLGLKLAPGNNALSGEAKIRDGVVQLPAVGERFTDVTARVVISKDRILVRDLTARGPTGKVTVRAAVRLDGLDLVNASAHISIKEREKIPVTLQGAALGDAWGKIAVLYRKKTDATEIRVDVPSLHVEMAEEGDLEVQSLDNVESIEIGARLSDGTFTTLPVQPLASGSGGSEETSPTKVRIKLGRDVEIQKGLALRVKLGGELEMTSDGESRMNGRLELRGGKLDVQGKLFDIERGVVTFSGDPANPTITATARWDSPAGYSVYADYTGDVKNGKITLRSEPPLNQDEIASLLMFGDPEGSLGTGSGNTDSAATAVGVAGDTAAKGINRAISDLTRLDVAARVDTSTGTARPELVMQLTPRVSAKVTRAVGEPQAGQPPDRTFFTVEFRFTRSWSVSGVVGDHGGSGMDVIWRRRY
jgi:autotransporter translocation and assembly factor TamB